MALLAGGILLAAPCIFIINNISNLDKIVKTLGIYIVLIVILGLVSLFISAHLTKGNIVKKETAVLHSAIRKIMKADIIKID